MSWESTFGPLWLTQGCGCSPKCWWQMPCFLWAQIWKHGTRIIGKFFTKNLHLSPSPNMFLGWLLFIHSNSTQGIELLSLLTLVFLAPSCKGSQGWQGTETTPYQKLLTENACLIWSCSKQSQQFITSLNVLFIYQAEPWGGWNLSEKMKEAQYLINRSVWNSYCEWCFKNANIICNYSKLHIIYVVLVHGSNSLGKHFTINSGW